MAREATKPLEITAWMRDGQLNSADGIIMFDSILYHAWFLKHRPEVFLGMLPDEYAGHIGLPLRQMPGNRYCASRGIYTEIRKDVHYINKRPNYMGADKIDYLAQDKGVISESVGIFRAYRMPNVIRTIADGKITFYAMGHREDVEDLLSYIPAVGKKYAAGYGIIERWQVQECDEDYSLWHPDHGLMRPVMEDEELDPEIMQKIKDGGYPKLQYGIRPPYWKPKNFRICYVPRADA